MLAAVAVGGMVGASGRYGLNRLLPYALGEWPWATLLTNVSGCLLIGVLLGTITRIGREHRLVRPFLGVGVLGGYTTFSTYAVDAFGLITAGRWGLALLYLVGTAVAATLAVLLGDGLARSWHIRRTRRNSPPLANGPAP